MQAITSLSRLFGNYLPDFLCGEEVAVSPDHPRCFLLFEVLTRVCGSKVKGFPVCSLQTRVEVEPGFMEDLLLVRSSAWT